jgi:hypothetical protein
MPKAQKASVRLSIDDNTNNFPTAIAVSISHVGTLQEMI